MRLLRDSFAPVVDLLYPPRCPLCGEAIEQQSGLCLDCWNGLEIPPEPACALCQAKLPQSEAAEGTLCGQCIADPPIHAGIRAATIYNDASRQLVLRFKHGRRIALAGMMARLMAARLGTIEENAVLVPVPLHRWRIWRRGYNQAALLAHELGRLIGSEVVVDALQRKRQTPPLGGLGRKQRRRVLSGAIAPTARARDRIGDRAVILVDDVMTSGATSEACVKALRQAGARSVRIACFARVV